MTDRHLTSLSDTDYSVYKKTILSLNSQLSIATQPYDAATLNDIEYITNDYTRYMLDISTTEYNILNNIKQNNELSDCLSDLYIV
jgi:hypothetical protein